MIIGDRQPGTQEHNESRIKSEIHEQRLSGGEVGEGGRGLEEQEVQPLSRCKHILAAGRLGSCVTGTQCVPKTAPVPPSSKQACKGSKHKPLNVTVGFLWLLFHAATFKRSEIIIQQ